MNTEQATVADALNDAELREKLFNGDPNCRHCRKTIDTLAEAAVLVHFGPIRRGPVILHKSPCLALEILASGNREAGISPTAFRRLK